MKYDKTKRFILGTSWGYWIWFLFAAVGQMSWVMACAFSGFILAVTLTATGVKQYKVTRQKRNAELYQTCPECGVHGAHGLIDSETGLCGDCSDSHVLEKARALVYDEEGMPQYVPLDPSSPASQLTAISRSYGLPVAGPPLKEFTREEEARYRNAQANHGLTEQELSDYQAERDAVADAATAVQDYVPKGQEELYALLHKKLRDQVAEVILTRGEAQPAHWEVHPKWMHDVEHVRPGASRISRLYGYPLHVADEYGVPELVLDPEPPPAPPEPEPGPEDPYRQSWNLGRKRAEPPDWAVIPVTGKRAEREDRYFKDRKDGYRK
jgi:hypothetical protein